MEQPASTLSAIHTSNSNVLERTAQKVSYAPDLLRQPDDDDTIKANSVKGSRAGSVYYSASESGTQSVPASVYQSGDLDDSDGEFELEVDGSSRTDAGLSQNATGMSKLALLASDKQEP